MSETPLHELHRRTLTVSTDQNGELHRMQIRQPTDLTTRGGFRSKSNTGSRRLHPSKGQGSGS